MCVVPLEARRVCWIPGPGVTDDCKPPCGCWELVSGPLRDQPVLLTSEPVSPAPREAFCHVYSQLSDIRKKATLCEGHSHDAGRLGDILLGIRKYEDHGTAGVNLTGILCLQAAVQNDF